MASALVAAALHNAGHGDIRHSNRAAPAVEAQPARQEVREQSRSVFMAVSIQIRLSVIVGVHVGVPKKTHT